MEVLPFEYFEKIFKQKAGDLWTQGEKVFKNYGENLSNQTTSVLLYASEANKLSETLKELEEKFEKDIKYQHPSIRATRSDNIAFFNRLHEKLGAVPQS